jgi:hypothetical protein
MTRSESKVTAREGALFGLMGVLGIRVLTPRELFRKMEREKK